MKQNFTLSINTPCAEKFESFQSTKQGGFCQSCQKEVIDFTKMTDKEILQFFKNSQEKTCGRFHDFQLKTYSEALSPKKQNLWKAFGMGLMSFSLFSLFSIQKSEAKNHTSVINPISEKENDYQPIHHSKVLGDSISVEGNIIDENGEPLPGVTILIKGTPRGTASGINGDFTIHNVNIGDILIFSGVGLETEELTIRGTSSNKLDAQIVEMKMKVMSCVMVGEVAVKHVYQSKPSLWQRIKNIFR